MIQSEKLPDSGRCGEELMLYLHIPFCVKKCRYCDFLSGPYPEEVRKKYLKALLKEIRCRCGELSDKTVTSIFFGGGTPSLLEPEEVEAVLGECRKYLYIRDDAEITMECNPGTADRRKFDGYREAGVNRLSLGLQSPREEELRLLGRIHTWNQFLETYNQAREAGFDNVNIDLMSALPGQNLRKWKENLGRILALNPPPEHLSVYSLILEEGTELFEMERKGLLCRELALPSEDEDREMYHATARILKKFGFEQYEISNYARSGYACRHNCGYWTRREYLGLGVGAASLLGEKRFNNERDIQKYMEDPFAGRQEEVLGTKDIVEEFMFLGLRMLEGVGRKEFRMRFGKSMDEVYGDVIRKNCGEGMLADDGERIRLTERGLDLANYVMAQFLSQEDG